MAMMNTARRFVLNNEVYITLSPNFLTSWKKLKQRTKSSPTTTVVDIKKVEMRMVAASSQRRLAEATKGVAEERLAAVKSSIALVNCDFDAMVLAKDKQLIEATVKLEKSMKELETVKASMEEAEARTVKLYKKSISSTHEYSHMASGDQLTERIRTVHPEWDL
ncbi:hypothetical protein Fot_14276 [Forsythia ovata]|uniref:Uncharacterized protein n=1 Tax=Forsythia ovata TaxID=205694 RepID=A0ABD1W8F6_9LAMI